MANQVSSDSRTYESELAGVCMLLCKYTRASLHEDEHPDSGSDCRCETTCSRRKHMISATLRYPSSSALKAGGPKCYGPKASQGTLEQRRAGKLTRALGG